MNTDYEGSKHQMEYEAPEGFTAPEAGSQGQSKIMYGEDGAYYGDMEYCPPGKEGMYACKMQLENGGIGTKDENDGGR